MLAMVLPAKRRIWERLEVGQAPAALGSADRSAEGGKLFTGHVARVIGRVQLDQYSVRVSELEAFF